MEYQFKKKGIPVCTINIGDKMTKTNGKKPLLGNGLYRQSKSGINDQAY